MNRAGAIRSFVPSRRVTVREVDDKKKLGFIWRKPKLGPNCKPKKALRTSYFNLLTAI